VPLRPTDMKPESPIVRSSLPTPLTLAVPRPPAAPSLLPPMPIVLAVIFEPPPIDRMPVLSELLPTMMVPVAPTLTVLLPVIVIKPMPLVRRSARSRWPRSR